MKRRIVVAIVLVAGLAVTAFGIPLGLVIDREFESQALLNLERAAILAERDIPTGWRPGDELTLDRATGDIRFGVYDANGVLVSGEGPTNGDEAVRTALEDRVGEAEVDNADVITVPITDGPVVGVLRAAQPLAATDRRVRAAWASMGLLAFAVIAGAVILAGRLARRISVPIEALHANAATLGTDALAPPLPSSGMAEIDDVAGALEHAARRVEESVQRERLFSAAVSHQLRTPITALRLLVDTELAAPRADPAELLHEAAGAVTRLESTVEELLSLTRNRPADRAELQLEVLLGEVAQRWQGTYRNAGRCLQVAATIDEAVARVPVVASHSALGHVLDVLLDNALRHGSGLVDVSVELVEGGVAVRVADEGSVLRKVIEDVFERASSGPSGPAGDRDVTRRKIGLGLARRLAQAENGDLVCSSNSPTEFSLLLVPPRGGPASPPAGRVGP